MLVGEHRSVWEFADHLLARPNTGCEIVGVCATGGELAMIVRGKSVPVLAEPDAMVSAAFDVQADAVAVANPAGFDHFTLQRAAWLLERSGIDLLVAPDVVSVAGPRIRVATMNGLPLLHITEPRTEGLLRGCHSEAYRLMTVAIAVLLSPVVLLLSLAILIDSGGPVLYRQVRVGYRGREFEMLKFRTMVPGADDMLPDLLTYNEHDGALFKIRQDPRVTRVGRFLRRHSLDEIPQLLNVIKGEMLLVGPRPCRPRRCRSSVKPNIAASLSSQA